MESHILMMNNDSKYFIIIQNHNRGVKYYAKMYVYIIHFITNKFLKCIN